MEQFLLNRYCSENALILSSYPLCENPPFPDPTWWQCLRSIRYGTKAVTSHPPFGIFLDIPSSSSSAPVRHLFRIPSLHIPSVAPAYRYPSIKHMIAMLKLQEIFRVTVDHLVGHKASSAFNPCPAASMSFLGEPTVHNVVILTLYYLLKMIPTWWSSTRTNHADTYILRHLLKFNSSPSRPRYHITS